MSNTYERNPQQPFLEKETQESSERTGKDVREFGSSISERSKEVGSEVGTQVRETASRLSERAKEGVASVKERTDSAISSTGRNLENAGQRLRERGPHEGVLGQASSRIANALEQSGRYLEEHGVSEMAQDLGNTIRRNPIPAVFIGIGVGYMLGRMMTSNR